jgi:DNA-binding transcriptional regulator YhcF (GntR family)
MSMPIVEIDTASAVPPFEQLRAQVAAMVSSGALPVGAKLPTVRQLAADLGLAPGTVARAYRELEADGVLATRGRHGTFVAGVRRLSRRQVARELDRLAGEYLRAAQQLGYEPIDAVGAAQRAAAVETGRRAAKPAN